MTPIVTPEDRWALPSSSIGRFSVGMATVLVVSLALHAILVAIAALNVGTSVAPPQEAVAVELVREIPKEIPKEVPKPAPAAQEAEAAAAPKIEEQKVESEKVKPPKPEPAKVEPAKIEQAKIEPEKPDAKPQPAKQEAPKPDAPTETADEATLKGLESQVEALKAERAALEAEQVAEADRTPAAASGARGPIGMGPLPESFQAIALPASSDAIGDAFGYQQIVFSQLAKANEIGKTQGLPGSSGVHFEIDDAGKLISAAVIKPSGVPSLDAMALTIVRKATPFPPPPQGAQRSFDANVNFVAEAR